MAIENDTLHLFDRLPLLEVRPVLQAPTIGSGRTAGGSILTASAGASLWRAKVILRRMLRSRADEVLSLLSVYAQPGGTFLAHAFPRVNPKADPKGEIFGTRTVTLSQIAGNRRDIRLTGLGAYELSGGDGLSFPYGSNPERIAWHRVVSTQVKTSGAQTQVFEVTPPLRPGASTGAPVRILKPWFRALILPDTINEGSENGRWVDGISFDIQQYLR